jgi:hypothetical protein
MALSDRTVLLLLLALSCGLGLLRLVRSKLRLSEEMAFAAEFMQKLKAYVESNGSDTESYGWLTHRSNKMQQKMGYHGVYASYRPPYANFQYPNYPIILNMLPELRKTFEDDVLRRSDLPHQYAVSIQEAVIRYDGVLEDREDEILKNIRNPVIWFREGVRMIVALPVSLLGWLGALSEKSVLTLTSSKVFRIFAAVVGFVSFVSAVMGITLGWEQFHTMVRGWFNAI